MGNLDLQGVAGKSADFYDVDIVQRNYQETRTKITTRGLLARLGVIAATALTVVILNIMLYQQEDTLRGFHVALVVYSSWLFAIVIARWFLAWYYYQNPAVPSSTDHNKKNDSSSTANLSYPLVTVIIPIYNEEKLIEKVIDAVFQSAYLHLEVIAINDGSKDRTPLILSELQKKYPQLIVINKENGGKRSAVAKGFYASHGDYLVMMDSDTIVDENAISEFIASFRADPNIGALAGNVRALNSEQNLLTKCQCCAYDYGFNIVKRSESHYGSVMCCCGCLAAYRRDAVADFIRHWSSDSLQKKDLNDNKNGNSYGQRMKKRRPSLRGIESIASYDDCEDSGLTVYTLLQRPTKFVLSAVGYADIPSTITGYYRQQVRWTKGSLRTHLFAASFMWKKDVLMAAMFYSGLVNSLIFPFLFAAILLIEGLSRSYFMWIGLTVSFVLIGLLHAVDFKLRYPKTKYWKYSILSFFMMAAVVVVTLLPAVVTYRKDRWMTR